MTTSWRELEERAGIGHSFDRRGGRGSVVRPLPRLLPLGQPGSQGGVGPELRRQPWTEAKEADRRPLTWVVPYQRCSWCSANRENTGRSCTSLTRFPALWVWQRPMTIPLLSEGRDRGGHSKVVRGTEGETDLAADRAGCGGAAGELRGDQRSGGETESGLRNTPSGPSGYATTVDAIAGTLPLQSLKTSSEVKGRSVHRLCVVVSGSHSWTGEQPDARHCPQQLQNVASLCGTAMCKSISDAAYQPQPASQLVALVRIIEPLVQVQVKPSTTLHFVNKLSVLAEWLRGQVTHDRQQQDRHISQMGRTSRTSPVQIACLDELRVGGRVGADV